MNKTFEGKAGVKATVLADSINEAGNRLITFEVEVTRIIWSEFLTHRMISRNAASSRAIPFTKMVAQLNGKPARFGKNIAGMQDAGEHNELINGKHTPEEWWDLAKESAIEFSKGFADAGYHKQISSRGIETYSLIKSVVSATEWANFFWLRDDDAADPSIRELARVMLEAKNASVPKLLKAGEYHLPYVDSVINNNGQQVFFIRELKEDTLQIQKWRLSLEEAIKVSCARCASVSFRNEGYGLQKSIEVYNRLVGSERKHASALEHVATPMQDEYVEYYTASDDLDEYLSSNVAAFPSTWEAGVSHADKNGNLWSGNIQGFIQYRKTVQGENYEG